MKCTASRLAIILLTIGAGMFCAPQNILQPVTKEPSHRTVGASFISIAAPQEKTANDSALVSETTSQRSDNRIIYIQAVRYKPDISGAQIEELLQSLSSTLRKIPQVKSIRIGRVVDAGTPYDYAVVMEFDNLDDLKAYGRSEVHRRWVEEHHTPALAAAHITLTILTESNK